MKILLVEDEKLSAEHLKTLLRRIDANITFVGVFDSIKNTVAFLNEKPKLDLIFMDIHLADGISFDIFNHIQIETPLIFTTAYDEYALRAFKVNSIDYLLKPIGLQDLKIAIEKYKKWNTSPLFEEKINDLLFYTQKSFKNRFLVKMGDTIQSIKAQEINHFVAEDGVVLLVTQKGRRFSLDYTLDQLEQLVDSTLFYRINRKVILHIEAIEKVSSYFNSRLKIHSHYLNEDDGIVSRERVNAFKLWLDK